MIIEDKVVLYPVKLSLLFLKC